MACAESRRAFALCGAAPGIQKSIAYECTSPWPSTELHQRAPGGIKKCCFIKETRQMLRRGHSNLAQATWENSSRCT